MIALRHVSFWAVAFLALPVGASAQNTMPNLPSFGGGSERDSRVVGPPNQPSLLTVAATRPIVSGTGSRTALGPNVEGSFRIAFRVSAPEGNVPFVTIGYGGWRSDFILDWDAYSSQGARCVATRARLAGVDVFSGGTIGASDSLRSLQSQTTAGSVASSTRATIVSADFDCDRPVGPGDTVTVQIKFFALSGGWRTAAYSFDELLVGAGR